VSAMPLPDSARRAERADLPAAMPAPAIGAESCDRHVLVVDDEPTIGEVLREMLQDEGWRVTTRVAPPTVEEIGELKPDVIVLDLIFRRANAGLPFLAELRARPMAAIPVVVCTAAQEHLRLLDGMAPEGLGVVVKPFDLDEMVRAVTAARAGTPERRRSCGRGVGRQNQELSLDVAMDEAG
jgi:CheY-like chemotaxis protein